MTYWTLRKTIRKYITFAELEMWKKHKPSQPHPEVLLICESERLERTVKKLVEKELDRSYVELGVKVVDPDEEFLV